MWHLQRRSAPRGHFPGLPQEFVLNEVLSKDVFNLHKEDNLAQFLPVDEPALQLGMRHPNLVQVCQFLGAIPCGHRSRSPNR